MKRDMGLIRLQLLQIEGEKEVPELLNYNDEQKLYHMVLCIEGGLVDGEIVRDGGARPAQAAPIRLTWKGHEFLDAARNGTIWEKTLDRFKKAGIQMTLPLLQEMLKWGPRKFLACLNRAGSFLPQESGGRVRRRRPRRA